MSGFVGKVATLAAKDLRIEARGRATLPPMLAFAITVAILLAFALPSTLSAQAPVDGPAGTVAVSDVVAAFVWVTILFAGLIGFARTFEVEREDGALDLLLLAPLDRSGHFLAKGLANLAFIALVEVVVIPLVVVLFSVDVGPQVAPLLLVVALVDIGFVAVGTLFAAVAAQTRSRELVLPILALPALVPVFIAAFELTADAFAGRSFDAVAGRGWFGILIAFDVIVGIASALLFEFTLDA